MAEPPSGTVTLLFSDIEGSTRLLQRLGQDRYGQLLATYRYLLAQAFQERDGYQVDAQGDSIFAAFRRAVDAVVAATAVQRALAEQRWPEGVVVQARMGLHTGEPTLVQEGYVGLDVHRAARLCAAASGGQVLLSRTTRDLVEDERPLGVSLRDLGQHWLKDLDRPEHVFQLVISDLPADFPPLTTLDGGSPRMQVEETIRSMQRREAVGPASEQPGPVLQAFLLGGFRVLLRGQVLPDSVWRRRKARQLLKCLLARPQHRLTRDEAVELLWPESDSDAAATNLRSAIHAIRRALQSAEPSGGADLLIVDRDTIGLRPDVGIWVDTEAFERALSQARQAADPVPLLEEADALYAGDFLPEDLYEDWAVERRESLKRLWTELQLILARHLEEHGDPEGATTALDRLLRAEPSDERAAQELMRLFMRQGRRTDALRIYQRLVVSLRDDLGVEPAEETIELQRQVVAGEIAAATPRRVPGHTRPTEFSCSYPFPMPGRLIGRQPEFALLEGVLEKGATSGQVVLLGAPAGTGKSTLVGALVRRAEEGGVLCLAGGCYEQEGTVPLGPFQDALAGYLLAEPPERVRAELGGAASDLARVVPELRYHLDLPAEIEPEHTEQSRLFGAVHACLRSLAARGPALLCLEDLHAADAASLQLLHYLARQTRRLPIVLVGTFRTEQAPQGQPLARALAALTRERLAQIVRLEPFDREDTARLVDALLDGPPSGELIEWLYTTSEGNALFVEQLVMALREDGRLANRGGLWHRTAALDHAVPTIIREVIGQRLQRLSARCRETLAMIAVLGQTVQHGVLLAALQPSDEAALLADLEEALGADLLKETANCYAFGHILLRQTVYWGISAPRRMVLHARAGETLERLAGSRASDQAAELAHHFTLAGQAEAFRSKALRYSLEAGRHAAALSAHREALAHFNTACELIEREGEQADPAARLTALEGRGYAERELGMWLPSIATFRRVLDLTCEPLRRAWARGAIGYALDHTLEISAALAECDAGLAELASAPEGPETAVARLRLQYEKAYLWFLRGRFGDLLELGEQMLPLARELGHLGCLFWAHSVLGWAYVGRGEVELALEQHGLALAAAEQADDKVQMAIAHENMGIQYYRSGQFSAAQAHLGRAVSLYRDSANDLRAVHPLQALGRLYLAEGHVDRAREQAEAALALATEGQDRRAAECYDLLGAVHALRADWKAAEVSFERALGIREHVGHAAGQVDSLVGLGLVHQRRGEWPRAIELFSRAVAVANAMDPSPQKVTARRHLGRLLWLMGQESAATNEMEDALTLAESISKSLEYAPTLLVMAEIRFGAEDVAGAIGYAERALESGITAELTVEAHVVLASLHAMAARPEPARPHAEEALRLAERVGGPRLLGLAWLAAARVAMAADDHLAAERCLRDALDALERAGTPYERALALREFGRALAMDPGQTRRARVMLEEALGLFRQLGAGRAEGRVRDVLRSLQLTGPRSS